MRRFAAVLILTLATSGGAPAVVYYVDQNAPGPTHDGSSWQTAFLRIQDAANAVSTASGDEIWVARGTYYENVEIRLKTTYLPEPTGLLGGFAGNEVLREERDHIANPTIIDGRGCGSCIFIWFDFSFPGPGVIPEASVDGFVLTNGVGEDGGGIRLETVDATVVNNVIFGNSTIYGGGGGISCADFCTPFIANNLIYANTAEYGGGIHVDACCDPTIVHNTIVWNESTMEEGGGIYLFGSHGLIANNIIAENGAYTGAGIFRSCGDPALWHNDVWHNAGGDYEGIAPGAGDMGCDPMFRDRWLPDLRLAPDSLCIDAGDPDAVGGLLFDSEGDPRVVGGAPDIGADERIVAQAPAGLMNPGWVQFSIPRAPLETSEASDLLGFNARNRLYAWDNNTRTTILYPDDFTELAPARGYLVGIRIGESYAPGYEAGGPPPRTVSFESAGWAWVGLPWPDDQPGRLIHVVNKVTGEARTAEQDVAAGPEAWVNWNWLYWDSGEHTFKIMNPFGAGDDDTLRAWHGYCAFLFDGGITLVFPPHEQ
jgi:hypothetical protein